MRILVFVDIIMKVLQTSCFRIVHNLRHAAPAHLGSNHTGMLTKAMHCAVSTIYNGGSRQGASVAQTLLKNDTYKSAVGFW